MLLPAGETTEGGVSPPKVRWPKSDVLNEIMLISMLRMFLKPRLKKVKEHK